MRFTCSRSSLMAAIIFALLPCVWASDVQSILYTFTGKADGAGPTNVLIADASGNLYGTAAGGGVNNYGTVFELSPNSSGGWTETVLYSFAGGDAGDGSNPMGIAFDGNGNIFGLTRLGGTSDSVCGCGAVFELSPGSNGGWTEAVLYRFTLQSGISPLGAPTLDAEGNLYGTTSGGGANGYGTVFELSPEAKGGWIEKTVFDFSSTSGVEPFTNVILDSSGNLYGVTTGRGGPDGTAKGTVYKLSKVAWGWSFTLLYIFRGPRGAYPVGGLVFDSAGNLYGTTSEGGAANFGTVFELTPTTQGQWKETLLHDFTGGSDGGIPWAGLTIDAAGSLYGIAAFTETNTAFKLSPSPRGGWFFEVLADLAPSDNYVNTAPFLLNSAGNLFNVSSAGGGGSCDPGCGFVYEVSPGK
ncbi:MAG TPA: choice-of-anchor tandem repeat GloVer-containing protein [Candidatus Sulfotelmatobacter sp.]